MSRDRMLDRAMELRPWHVIVVGGGCTGIATALDAAARGYRTLLVERGVFTGGTSSRSTKLVHGGVRFHDGQFDDTRLGAGSLHR